MNSVSIINFFYEISELFILIIFLILVFNKSPLHISVEKGNQEILQLLLQRPDIDVNAKSILINFFYTIHTKFFNYVLKQCLFNTISNFEFFK